MAKAICLIKDCTTPAQSRGWCWRHYYRWYRYGDPLYTKRLRGVDPATRFWTKVNKDGPVPKHRPELGPCWVWTDAPNDQGYGVFCIGENGKVKAHRYAYTLLVGPVPEGLMPDHLCRNRACVKAITNEQGPTHLEPVTNRENLLRGIKGVLTTHCPKGHPYDAVNTRMRRDGKGRECIACERSRPRRPKKAKEVT